jgi:hypothetical protein
MPTKSSKPKTDATDNSLVLSDLNGDIDKTLVHADSHFGLSSAVWKNAQRIADMLPIDLQVFGDLSEEDVAYIIDKTKGSDIQLKNWTEYSSQTDKFLKNLIKIREKQILVAENTAEARVSIAELEKELGTNLANLESKFRQIMGNSRSAIAAAQDDLAISLGKIASQYSENKEKKQAKLSEAKEKREPTAYETQTSDLAARFQELRQQRCASAIGVTQRIKAAK